MKRHLRGAIVLGAAAALVGCAGGEIESAGDPQSENAEVARLGANARVPADVAVRDYLRAHGLGREGAEALRAVRSARSRDNRFTHLRLEQEVGGLRVEGPYVKATVDEAGGVVDVIDRAARFTRASFVAARLDEAQALRAAMAAVHPGVAVDTTAVSRDGNKTAFRKGTFFHEEPTVERVALPAGTDLAEGFLVQTWTRDGNRLHETLVSGDGAVLEVTLRTNTDSYLVFKENPDTTPQSVVNGPTTRPWLFAGPQKTHDIAGNNVHAYLDAVADNAPDASGSPVTSGDFLTAWDGSVTPSTDGNKAVAAQNLFYLNNVMHDTLYAHGFDEAAGNFQEDNFGLGGRASDSVNAEAQDGGGTDNANFATPRDGQNPRMQMYLWTGVGDDQLVVTAPASVAGTYTAQAAGFGGAVDTTGLSGTIVLVNDGSTGDGTGTVTDACEALPAGSLAGKIAFMDRGLCSFVIKVKNVQDAGAIAAVVANNRDATSIFAMGGTDATITIPAAMIGQNDGNKLRGVATAGSLRKTDPAPLQRDGDVDSDIVYHEYGHGLTWRMIGRMNGPMAGAIGEGMSDVLSIILNDDPIVGEYAYSDPRGIRSAPYDAFPRTYSSVTGSEVHYDGEVYAAIGWDLFVRFGRKVDPLLGYLVDGMNYTPAQPTFEEMRDGVLAAVTDPAHDCLVWKSFAKFGVGVGAKAVVRRNGITVTESFAIPATCQ